MTTIEELLALDDAHQEVVTVDVWGGAQVRVCSMTARERADLEKRWAEKKASSDPLGFRRDLLLLSLKKADGTPFGTEDQITKLMDKNAKGVEQLFETACRINGFTKADVEEMAKN